MSFVFSTTQKTTRKTTQKTTQKIPTRQLILNVINQNPNITVLEMSEILHLSFDAVRYHIKTLKSNGSIVHKGPDKGGYWLVIKKE